MMQFCFMVFFSSSICLDVIASCLGVTWSGKGRTAEIMFRHR
jgi:hypothetical protein